MPFSLNHFRLAIQLVLGATVLTLTTFLLPTGLGDELNLVALCLFWTAIVLAALSPGSQPQRLASSAAVLFLTKSFLQLPGHNYLFPLTAASTLGMLSLPGLLFGLACAKVASDTQQSARARWLTRLCLFPLGFGLVSLILSVAWFGWGLAMPVPNSGAPVGLALFFVWGRVLGSVCLLTIPIWLFFFGKELYRLSLDLPVNPFRPVGLGLLVFSLVLGHLMIVPTQRSKAQWLAGIEKGMECKVVKVQWQTISGPSELDLGVMEVTPESGYGGISPELDRQLKAHSLESKSGQQILYCKHKQGLLIRRRTDPDALKQTNLAQMHSHNVEVSGENPSEKHPELELGYQMALNPPETGKLATWEWTGGGTLSLWIDYPGPVTSEMLRQRCILEMLAEFPAKPGLLVLHAGRLSGQGWAPLQSVLYRPVDGSLENTTPRQLLR